MGNLKVATEVNRLAGKIYRGVACGALSGALAASYWVEQWWGFLVMVVLAVVAVRCTIAAALAFTGHVIGKALEEES